MAIWKIYTTNDGKIAVSTPYNPQIVAECKRRMGKWIDLTITKKDASTATIKAWKLDASHRPAIEALCAELFPEAGELITRVVTWTADEYSLNPPTIDGYKVVWFGRDNFNIAQANPGEPFEIIEVMENTLQTGGSRNNPRLYGKLTLKMRCRPQAVAAGQDWNVEVLD